MFPFNATTFLFLHIALKTWSFQSLTSLKFEPVYYYEIYLGSSSLGLYVQLY
jgi:hypothetical protein